MRVEGIETHVHTQGQPYEIEFDCAPDGSVVVFFGADYNDNGTLDDDEILNVGDIELCDNCPPDDDNPFFDSNPTLGIITLSMFIHFAPGNWFFGVIEGDDMVVLPIEEHAIDPVVNSFEGNLTFEGITPPDSRLNHLPCIAGTMEPPVLMFFLADDFGNFAFNWVGDAGSIVLQVIADEHWLDAYNDDDLTTVIRVDGATTGFSHFVRLGETSPSIWSLETFVDWASDTIMNMGQQLSFGVECGEGMTIYFELHPDFDEDNFPDFGYDDILSYTTVVDNGLSSGVYLTDDWSVDPSYIFSDLLITLPAGRWIITASDGSTSFAAPMRVAAVSASASLSGQVVFEDIVPPASLIDKLQLLLMDDFGNITCAFTDIYGNFSCNWIWDPALVHLSLLNNRDFMISYTAEDFTADIELDAHITDYEMYITRRSDSALDSFIILVDGVPSAVQVQGTPYSLVIGCDAGATVEMHIYYDVDSDGIYDEGEPDLVGAIEVGDNATPTNPFFSDSDMTAGLIYTNMFVHFWPAHLIFAARIGSDVLYAPLEVMAPDPVLYSVSGTLVFEGIEPPDDHLRMGMLAGTFEPPLLMFFPTNTDGSFSFNWPGESTTIQIFIPGGSDWMDAYVEEALDTSVFVDGIVTDFVMYVPLIEIGPQIEVDIFTDPDHLPLSPSEFSAYYVNAETHEVFDTFALPWSEDAIFVPVPDFECGIYFDLTMPEGRDHIFLAPRETLWVSPEDYPAYHAIFANPTNCHGYFFLDGFPLESIPDTGIELLLHNIDDEGFEYTTNSIVFIDLYAGEYMVFAHRELCDGTWRITIPSTLPDDYVPDFTETTFTITEDMDWSTSYVLHVPVHTTKVSEQLQNAPSIALSVFPNPFNCATTIEFSTPSTKNATVEIFNTDGKFITTLPVNGTNNKLTCTWDGTYANGESCASGIYLFRLTTVSDNSNTKKIHATKRGILLK